MDRNLLRKERAPAEPAALLWSMGRHLADVPPARIEATLAAEGLYLTR